MNVPEKDLSTAPWKKSKWSGDASNCVEVAKVERDQGE